ncbi:MAG: molybdate ABC transporter permease subunit, partial [Betaproteobacteria bacterium]
MGVGREARRQDRERARCAGARRPRRSAVGHRLCYRRACGEPCPGARPISGELASAHRVPGCDCCGTRFTARASVAELPCVGCGPFDLKVALCSVAFSLPLAIIIAYVLARFDFAGKTLLDALVHLPLVLPPVVVGYALLLIFGKQGALGAWLDRWLGIVFAFRWTGAALAAAIMGFPLMVRAIRLSMAAVDRRLETLARTLGAARVRVFVSVTLPLALPGIVTGALLSFARSLGEFGATITFVSNIPG